MDCARGAGRRFKRRREDADVGDSLLPTEEIGSQLEESAKASGLRASKTSCENAKKRPRSARRVPATHPELGVCRQRRLGGLCEQRGQRRSRRSSWVVPRLLAVCLSSRGLSRVACSPEPRPGTGTSRARLVGLLRAQPHPPRQHRGLRTRAGRGAPEARPQPGAPEWLPARLPTVHFGGHSQRSWEASAETRRRDGRVRARLRIPRHARRGARKGRGRPATRGFVRSGLSRTCLASSWPRLTAGDTRR